MNLFKLRITRDLLGTQATEPARAEPTRRTLRARNQGIRLAPAPLSGPTFIHLSGDASLLPGRLFGQDGQRRQDLLIRRRSSARDPTRPGLPCDRKALLLRGSRPLNFAVSRHNRRVPVSFPTRPDSGLPARRDLSDRIPYRERVHGRSRAGDAWDTYLLLWSAIERYASLRWGFGGGPMQRINNLVHEPAFGCALERHATPGRVVSRADNPCTETG
jgi:hypothetical protein